MQSSSTRSTAERSSWSPRRPHFHVAFELDVSFELQEPIKLAMVPSFTGPPPQEEVSHSNFTDPYAGKSYVLPDKRN